MINIFNADSSLKSLIRWKNIYNNLFTATVHATAKSRRFVVDNIPVKLWASRDRGIYIKCTLKRTRSEVERSRKENDCIFTLSNARMKPRSATSNQSKIISCSWAQFISTKMLLTKTVYSATTLRTRYPIQCGQRDLMLRGSCLMRFVFPDHYYKHRKRSRATKMSRRRILCAHILKWSKLM